MRRDGSANSAVRDAGELPRVQRDLRNACQFEALEGRCADVREISAAPLALMATATAPTDVKLQWKDNASTATGYNILRSTDGVHYTKLAQLTSAIRHELHGCHRALGHVYDYEIQAFNRTATSAASNVAAATTPLARRRV